MAQQNLKIEKLLLCENAFLSKDNKLNIIGILDIIFAPKIPATHPLMFLVGMILWGPRKQDELVLRLTAPSGEKFLPDKKIKIRTGRTGKGNFIVRIPGLELKEYGVYKIDVLRGGKKLATASFSLVPPGGEDERKKASKALPN